MGTGVPSTSDKPVQVPYYDAHIGPFYINIRRNAFHIKTFHDMTTIAQMNNIGHAG